LERSLWQRGKGIKSFAGRSVVCCLLLLHGRSGGQGVGGSSGAYLRPPMGAAATAMGGACTAAPDYYAPWWNPAVLANLRSSRIAAGTGLRPLGQVDAYGSLEFRVPPRVGVGVFALYRGVPSLGTLYDPDEKPLPASSYTTLTFKTAVSYYMTRRLSLGASLNVLYQSLPVPLFGSDGRLLGIHYVSATSIGSFDFAGTYRISDVLAIGAVLKNLGAKMEWQMGDWASMVVDRPLPSITLGSRLKGLLAQRPLVWTVDCIGYVFNGQNEAVLCTGAEWRRWNNFYVRAGIGDVAITGDIVRDGEQYSREFGMRFTAGFSYNLSRPLHKNVWINYSTATNRIWAGIDQQLDVTTSF
jgi:hypothetical protein